MSPVVAAPPDAALLRAHVPTLVYDRRERDFATDVAALPDRRFRGDVLYGHVVRDGGRTWLQYWAFEPYNGQDRGIVRTGRHQGDWEFVQLRLGAGGRPQRVTYAQHSWAESCSSTAIHPTVYVANGSHASYPSAGEHGRPWPDPNDQAGGDGRRVVPKVVVLDSRTTPWIDSPKL